MVFGKCFLSWKRTILDILKNIFDKGELENSILILGFINGGDRDGNPYVTPEITIKTAESLKFSILRNYFREIRKMKRSLTFDGLEENLIPLKMISMLHFFPKTNPNTLTSIILLML